MITLLYVCQLAEPDAHDLSVHAGQSDGEDDVAWFRSRLREVGLGDEVAVTAVYVCTGDALPDPEGFDAIVIGGSFHMVGEQREWQRVILGKLAVRFDVIEADAEDLGIEFAEREDVVAELAGLGGATRRLVLRVEIENDPLIAIVLERVQLAGLVRQFELRGQGADGRRLGSAA